MELENKNILLR